MTSQKIDDRQIHLIVFPTVDAFFIRTINCVKIIEKRIAKKNGKLKQHYEKWYSVCRLSSGNAAFTYFCFICFYYIITI